MELLYKFFLRYVLSMIRSDQVMKEDKTLTCCECGAEFVFTASEQEFYEEKGFFEEDDESDIEIDEDELIEFAIKNARKDKISNFTDEQIESVIAGELAYCDSLNLFD